MGRPDGVLLRTWKRSDPNFRRIAPLFGSGRLNIKDYVSNAVRLPGAGYATFVIKGPGPSRTYTDGYLEILDLNLNVVASPVLLGTAFGILTGAASDTELYFLRNTPTRRCERRQGLTATRAVVRCQWLARQ